MVHSSSDTAILTIEKSTLYRATREHWNNAYHLSLVPTDGAAWNALATAVVALEQPMLSASTQFEKIYGHTPGTPPVLVYEYDYPPTGEGGVAGTFVPSNLEYPCPGDVAFWVRYGTTQKTSLGKPIYLRNYYHDAHTGLTPDTLAVNQASRLTTLATAWVNGISAAGVTYVRAGPRGAIAQNHQNGQFLTTRTLKRRGKRKKPAP